MITPTREDYIRAIAHLADAQGMAQVVEIAGYLKLSKSTVSERLYELAVAGLVIHERYAGVILSRKGRSMAEKLTERHRLIEVFLHRTLHVPKQSIHHEADRLEHGFSEATIERLRAFLDNPKYCPHGQSIAGVKPSL